METLLELEGVCKNYPSFTLRDVGFTVPEGSIMGLIGENGAGKSTTIRLILNEIRRDGGSIRIFEKDNIKDEVSVKEQIGVVFDESCFSGEFRAKDVDLILKRVFKAWDRDLYRRYLRDFSLPPEKKIKEYSRGMRMKLGIAAALAHRPRLLILDEATSGLDPVMRSDILDLLLDFIQDEHCGILFSSHITSDLERVADYVTFLHEGQVVFSRAKDELEEHLGLLKCGASQLDKLDSSDFLRVRRGSFECEALVADRAAAKRKYPELVIDAAPLDEIMLLYAKGENS
ncbi:Vitamin B12 import ATP-binding protein BtuD [Caprobacter fermentans]|uniref:Vitamin B12 import ATP-binding protein BtuD n=1 Tax=Caproicibacter fermentans TaxID=2576756 RepID=A0A6N8I000_9FIRM|nr:ABC transporter ATP-binding protein [Caproicibacter fermentans]MVB11100.1 Vitamin B12 import ATP-binding protein BtuD [Caproicibacter fermentans]